MSNNTEGDQLRHFTRTEQLAAIQKALNDEDAYGALMAALNKLDAIIQIAKERNCCCYSARIDLRSLSLRLRFQNYEGGDYKKSLSFAKAYERSGKPFLLDVALDLKSAIDSLVLNTEGIEAMRRVH
jgi:hypothetical protein